MKPVITPIYFPTGFDASYHEQLARIHAALDGVAEIGAPIEIGKEIPPQTELVLIPVLVGEAYSRLSELQALQRPVLLLTSEFMTIAMWDWEIRTFLESHGVQTLAPYSLAQTLTICRTLCLRKQAQEAVFLVYQETPGDGMQPEIFKRFFWWEQECTQRMQAAWGVRVEKRSLKELGARAKQIPDARADEVLSQHAIAWKNASETAQRAAAKLYLAIRQDVRALPGVRGVGTNCLNESFYCETTPCLAWDLLYRTEGLLWACEADLLSLLTKFLLHSATQAPVMMTNLYPFLMGMAAVKHEKIDAFPTVSQPDNCLLGVHCGYFGLMPQSFAAQCDVCPKVLEIVNENAIAVDARYAEGPVTIVQLHQSMNELLVVRGALESYAQYPGSDCRRGAVIRVADGPALMRNYYSHHAIVMSGDHAAEIELMAKLLGMELVVL